LPKNRLSPNHASSFSSSLFPLELAGRVHANRSDQLRSSLSALKVTQKNPAHLVFSETYKNCFVQKSQTPLFSMGSAHLPQKHPGGIPSAHRWPPPFPFGNGSVLISLLRYLIASLPGYLIPAPLCETRSSLSRGASQ
jgi:hypothetical protein